MKHSIDRSIGLSNENPPGPSASANFLAFFRLSGGVCQVQQRLVNNARTGAAPPTRRTPARPAPHDDVRAGGIMSCWRGTIPQALPEGLAFGLRPPRTTRLLLEIKLRRRGGHHKRRRVLFSFSSPAKSSDGDRQAFASSPSSPARADKAPIHLPLTPQHKPQGAGRLQAPQQTPETNTFLLLRSERPLPSSRRVCVMWEGVGQIVCSDPPLAHDPLGSTTPSRCLLALHTPRDRPRPLRFVANRPTRPAGRISAAAAASRRQQGGAARSLVPSRAWSE